jgi:kynurenine formamidase
LIARIDCNGLPIRVDFSAGRSIAIPLDPHGPQPAFFSGRPANARTLQVSGYVGDVQRGGSCNAETVEITPHCHGTHTECLGHLTEERQAVQETIYSEPVLARLASVRPGPGPGRKDSPRFSRAALEDALSGFRSPPVEALVIRALPNDPARRFRDYMEAPDYPVLGPQAMTWLASLPLRHLLVDSPSLDTPHDPMLANHRAWWGLDGREAPEGIDPARRSLTEMIWVPDELADGLYWLQLELSPLVGDATPSRPMLYPVEIA